MAPHPTNMSPKKLEEDERMNRISHSGLVARSPEGHAAKGMQIKGNEDLWVEIQAHTFRNWINEQLKPSGLVVRDLETDLCDGLKLIALLEVLQKKRIKKIAKPINQHQYLENVQFALNSIESDGIKLVNIGNEDIVNGNLKLILGLIWSLILRYQIGRSKFPPKKLMLAWLQAVLPECKPANFTTDWNSGISLSALLDYCKPGLFPHWRGLDPSDGVRNCKNAMELARREFGIPMVLEPEYLASPYLDELSGMTYLSYFMKENSPGYKATLGWAKERLPHQNISNFTTDWNDGLAACGLVRSFGGPIPDFDKLHKSEAEWEPNLDKAFQGGRRIHVEPLLKPKEMADPHVNHLGPMAYVARFQWLTAKNVPGERIKVSSDVKVVKINIPVKFKVELLDEDVDPRQVRAEIHGPNNYRTEIRLDFTSTPGVAHAVFLPEDIGMHQVVVTNEGELGTGCPLAVRATPETVKYTLGGIDPCAIGSIVEVLVSPNGAVGEGVEVAAIAPSGIEKSCPVTNDAEGVYMATFQPDEAGEWKIAVTYEGDHIEGSPFTCYVYDPNAIRVTDLEGACPCLDFTFTVDSRACGYGETIVDIVHQGRSIPHRVIPYEEGLSKVTFRPPERGKFRIYVYFNGIEPKASPFTLRVGSHDHDSKKLHELEKRTRKLLASGSDGGSKRSSIDTGSLPRMSKPIAARTNSGDNYAPIISPMLVMEGSSTTPRKHSTMPRTERRSSTSSSALNLTAEDATPSAVSKLLRDHGSERRGSSSSLTSSQQLDSARKDNYSSTFTSSLTRSGGLLTSLKRQEHHSSFSSKDVDDDGNAFTKPAGTSSPLFSSSAEQHDEKLARSFTSSGENKFSSSIASSLLKSSKAFKSSFDSSKDSPSGSRRGSKEAPLFESEVSFDTRRSQSPAGSGTMSSSYLNHKQSSRLVTSSMKSEDQTDVGLHRHLGHHIPSYYSNLPVDTQDDIMNSTEAKLIPVNKQCGFVISAEDARASDIQVDITSVALSPDGTANGPSTNLPYRVSDNRDGTFSIQYTPRAVGELTIDLRVKGTEVKGSPFRLFSYDASKIRVGRIPSGTVGKPVEFEIDGSHAGAGNLEILVNGGHVTSEVKNLGAPMKFLASFIPHQPISHTIDMKFNDHAVPGSPWRIDVKANTGVTSTPTKPTWQPSAKKLSTERGAIVVEGEPVRHVSCQQAARFDIAAPGYRKEDFDISITGPSRQTAPFRLNETMDRGNFRLEFSGTEVGTYSVDITASTGNRVTKVSGSPFVVKFYDASLIRVLDLPSGVDVGGTCSFKVDASQAGEGQLEISVCDGEVPNDVEVLGGGHCLVSFVPERAVDHNIEIKFNGDPVPGCPFFCQVTDASRVNVNLGHLELIPVDEPASFVIHVDGSTPAELGVSVRAPSQSTLPVRVNGTTRTGFHAEFVPKEVGAHSILVEYNGNAVTGTPYMAKVYDSKRVYVSPLPKGMIGKALQFTVDAGQAGEGNLEITISATGRNIPTQVHPQGNARFVVSFVPLEAVDHIISITFNKEDVSGSPFVVHISAESKTPTRQSAGHHNIGPTTGGKPSYFTISNVTGAVEDVEVNSAGGTPYKLRR